MAKMTVYDMIREKAKAMGYNAANIPNRVLEGCAAQNERQMNLLGAKLYLENYMMGSIDPADFARAMAENDQLRYTVSDLCRMRLEPRNLAIPERNNSYIDVGAGLKTFWAEMQVPLPSEQQAARDIRNINLGIEAARQGRQAGPAMQQDMPPVRQEEPAEQEASENDKPRRRSFKDVLNGAKQRAAAAAIDKLIPVAEGWNRVKIDEKWLASVEGQDYQEEYKNRTARQVENVVMDVEAGKSRDLAPEERIRAMLGAGMDEASAKEFVHDMVAEEKVSGLEESIREEYQANKGFTKEPMSIKDMESSPEPIPAEEYYTNLLKLDVLHTSDRSKGEKVDAEAMDKWRDLLKSEYRAELEAQRAPEAAAQDLPSRQVDAAPLNLRSGYSAKELSSSTSTQMEQLMEQISLHMGAGVEREPKKQEADKDSKQRLKKDKITGIYEGKEVSIKNSWSGHRFTDEELGKLFAGEEISFERDTRNGAQMVTGKLEWQEFNGREFLGFMPDYKREYGQKQEQKQEPSSNLFSENDEVLMKGYSEGLSEEETYYDIPFTDEDYEDQQRKLEEDMAKYKSEENSGLSKEDLDFGNGEDAQVL